MCVRNLKENRSSPSNHLDKKAWDSVTSETIQKCFKQCDFQTENKGEDSRFISKYAQVILIATVLPSY